jgi:hypothetical protein
VWGRYGTVMVLAKTTVVLLTRGSCLMFFQPAITPSARTLASCPRAALYISCGDSLMEYCIQGGVQVAARQGPRPSAPPIWRHLIFRNVARRRSAAHQPRGHHQLCDTTARADSIEGFRSTGAGQMPTGTHAMHANCRAPAVQLVSASSVAASSPIPGAP